MAIASGTWIPVNVAGVNCAINTTGTTKMCPLGTRVKCRDRNSATLYGEAEFIYLQGAANTIVGSAVTIHESDFTTTLTAARGKGPIGIAMSANVANQYGWYQIQGMGVVAVAGAVVDGAVAYLSATAGKLDDAVVAGDIVYGAAFSSADDTSLAKISLQYPASADTDNA